MLVSDEHKNTVKGNLSPIMKGDHPSTFVQFYVGGVYSEAKSTELNRPYYIDLDHIIITFAGNSTTVDRPIADHDKQRFGDQFKLWKDDNVKAMEGTPLGELKFLPPSAIADLNYHKIFNAETLAELPDTSVQSVGMGAQGWKNQAIAFLAESRTGAEKKRLAAENEILKTDLAAMKGQIAELSKMLDEQPRHSKTKAA